MMHGNLEYGIGDGAGKESAMDTDESSSPFLIITQKFGMPRW